MEPSKEYAKHLGKGYHSHDNDSAQGMGQPRKDGFKSVNAEYVILGWRKTCGCADKFSTIDRLNPIPCTVLDPFFGSGTVGLVALRLGRKWIGIEINPEYCKMARNRIYDDAPLFKQNLID